MLQLNWPTLRLTVPLSLSVQSFRQGAVFAAFGFVCTLFKPSGRIYILFSKMDGRGFMLIIFHFFPALLSIGHARTLEGSSTWPGEFWQALESMSCYSIAWWAWTASLIWGGTTWYSGYDLPLFRLLARAQHGMVGMAREQVQSPRHRGGASHLPRAQIQDVFHSAYRCTISNNKTTASNACW